MIESVSFHNVVLQLPAQHKELLRLTFRASDQPRWQDTRRFVPQAVVVMSLAVLHVISTNNTILLLNFINIISSELCIAQRSLVSRPLGRGRQWRDQAD